MHAFLIVFKMKLSGTRYRENAPRMKGAEVVERTRLKRLRGKSWREVDLFSLKGSIGTRMHGHLFIKIRIQLGVRRKVPNLQSKNVLEGFH